MHEVIEDMVAQNVRTATFEWEIAQVDENGNYTLDENGNYTTETKTVTITDKNGSYVMTCEQVVYLIDILQSLPESMYSVRTVTVWMCWHV